LGSRFLEFLERTFCWLPFLPDRSQSFVSHSRVDGCVGDVLVTHECLQSPSVNTTASQGIACRVSKHMDMEVGDACLVAQPFNQFLRTVNRQGSATLTHEEEARITIIPHDSTDQAHFIPIQSMDAGSAVLRPRNV
jgi:hypothetical protein